MVEVNCEDSAINDSLFIKEVNETWTRVFSVVSIESLGEANDTLSCFISLLRPFIDQ